MEVSTLDPARLRSGPWLPEEDAKLLEIIKRDYPDLEKNPDNPNATQPQWTTLANEVGTRNAKQCRERFHQNLKGGLKTGPMTPEEADFIEREVSTIGKRWAEIARKMIGRSDNAVKNWWNGSQSRRNRAVNAASSRGSVQVGAGGLAGGNGISKHHHHHHHAHAHVHAHPHHHHHHHHQPTSPSRRGRSRVPRRVSSPAMLSGASPALSQGSFYSEDHHHAGFRPQAYAGHAQNHASEYSQPYNQSPATAYRPAQSPGFASGSVSQPPAQSPGPFTSGFPSQALAPTPPPSADSAQRFLPPPIVIPRPPSQHETTPSLCSDGTSTPSEPSPPPAPYGNGYAGLRLAPIQEPLNIRREQPYLKPLEVAGYTPQNVWDPAKSPMSLFSDPGPSPRRAGFGAGELLTPNEATRQRPVSSGGALPSNIRSPTTLEVPKYAHASLQVTSPRPHDAIAPSPLRSSSLSGDVVKVYNTTPMIVDSPETERMHVSSLMV